MRYLVIPLDSEPFFTDWYIYENNYTEGMTVFDIFSCKYTNNGYDWKEVETNNIIIIWKH